MSDGRQMMQRIFGANVPSEQDITRGVVRLVIAAALCFAVVMIYLLVTAP